MLSPELLLIVLVSLTDKVTCTLAVALIRHRDTLLFPQTDDATPALKHRPSPRIRLWVTMLCHRPWWPQESAVWGFIKVHLTLYLLLLLLFFWNKVKAGTTPAAVSFPKVQREQAKRSRVPTEGPRSGLEHPAHPTIGASHPCGRTAAPSQGPLGSAAKVNNECIALIVKPIIHVALLHFFLQFREQFR